MTTSHYKGCYSFKRVFDISFAIIAILITFPLFIIIAFLVKLDGGPIFFRHKRVGRGGKEFYLIKFRTMVPDAQQRLKKILEENEDLKKEWEENFKLKNDPRITKIGFFLRKTSLDELPQFFNVLKGDMSIVGPRPVTKEELEKFYGDYIEVYEKVRPGITGYWQVESRSHVENYRERVEQDIWYIRNCSFLLDIKIILKTILIIFTGKGAY